MMSVPPGVLMDDSLTQLSDFNKLSALVASGAADDVQRLNALLKKLSASQDGWTLCAAVLLDQHPHYKCTDVRQEFFLYRVVETFLRERYHESLYDPSRPLIHQFLRSIFFHFASPRAFASFSSTSCDPSSNNNIPSLNSFTSGSASSMDSLRPQFIRNKAAQLFSLTMAVDYGSESAPWANFVRDMLQWVTQACAVSTEAKDHVEAYDFYLRIFLSIHTDVIGQGGEHECTPTSTRIKDTMRENDVKCMLQSWADILHFCVQYPTIHGCQQLTSLCCKVLSCYAVWMDTQLLTERYLLSGVMHLLASSLQPSNTGHVRLHKPLHYLRALCTKGMPAAQKVLLCNHLWQWLASLGPSGWLQQARCPHDSQDRENSAKVWENLALLLNTMAVQLFLAYKDLQRERSMLEETENGARLQVTPEQALESAEEKIDLGVVLLSPATKSSAEEEAQMRELSTACVESWREYLSILRSLLPSNSSSSSMVNGKSKSASTAPTRGGVHQVEMVHMLSQPRQERVMSLLLVVMRAMRYPPDYRFNHEGEEEEDFQAFRQELRVILSNVVHLAPNFVLNHIGVEMRKLFATDMNARPQVEEATSLLATVDFRHVEVLLYAFYHFGESVPRIRCEQLFDRRHFPLAEKMGELMELVCSTPISYMPHQEVLLLFFEVVVRYEAFFTPDRLPLLTEVLKAMLDQRGVRSSDRRVRLRSAYLFSRFIRSHKEQVKPFTADILQGISDLLLLPQPEHLRALDGSSAASDQCQQQAFIYETAAQLIFSTYGHMPQERVQYLSQLHKHIVHSVPGLVDVWMQHRRQINTAPHHGGLQGSAVLFRRKRDERCRECAQWLKAAMEMISRTSKVFSVQQPEGSAMGGSAPGGFNVMGRKRTGSSSTSTTPTGPLKTPFTTGCAPVFLDALRVFGEAWQKLREQDGNSVSYGGGCIWQGAGVVFLSGLRSFVHRMVAVCAPPPTTPVTTEDGGPSEVLDGQWMLDVLPVLMPLLFPSAAVLRQVAACDSQKDALDENVHREGLVECVRCIREFLPLLNQVIVQFKAYAAPLVSQVLCDLLDSVEACLECQPPLATAPTPTATISVVGDPELVEELKLVRRATAQLLSHATTLMPHVFNSLGATRFHAQLQSLLTYCADSLALSDAMTLKQLVLTVRHLLLAWHGEAAFCQHFVYPHILDLLFTMPVHRGFRLEDGQFFLVLNEIAHTWQILVEKLGDELLAVLQSRVFPTYQLPPNVSAEFLRHLTNREEMTFPTYLKKFYSTCKSS